MTEVTQADRTMDELVERCKEVAAKAADDWTYSSPSQRAHQSMSAAIVTAIIPIVADWQRERDAEEIERYKGAWRDLSEPLKWMQGHRALPVKYLGENIAWAASDMIAEAYPEFATAIRGAE